MSLTFSFDLTVLAGIFATLEIVSLISLELTNFDLFFSLIFTEAAVSSNKSIALSGSLELSKYFFERLTASLHSLLQISLYESLRKVFVFLQNFY